MTNLNKYSFINFEIHSVPYYIIHNGLKIYPKYFWLQFLITLQNQKHWFSGSGYQKVFVSFIYPIKTEMRFLLNLVLETVLKAPDFFKMKVPAVQRKLPNLPIYSLEFESGHPGSGGCEIRQKQVCRKLKIYFESLIHFGSYSLMLDIWGYFG